MPEWGPGSDADEVGDDSGSGPIITWDGIAPGWLQGSTAKVLKDFAEAPVGFLAGVVLNVVLGGLQNITNAFIAAIYTLYEGDTRGSATGSLGVADIPRVASNVLGRVGRAAGSAILDALTGLFTAFESAAAAAGAGAPILAAIALAGVILAAAYLLRASWTLIVDSINPL